MSGTGISEANCPYCGASHVGAVCHRLKRIEYNPDGLTIKAVEFHPPDAGSAMDPLKVCASPIPVSRVIGKEEW